MESLRLNIYVTAATEASSPSIDSPPLIPKLSLSALDSPKELKPRIARKGRKKPQVERIKKVQLPLTDREEVRKLNEWGREKTEEEQTSSNYRDHFNAIHQLIAIRKGGFPSPSLTRSLSHLNASLSSFRNLRATNDYELEEKSRLNRSYEADLEASAKSLEKELRALELDCLNSRKAKSQVCSKLILGALIPPPKPKVELHKEFVKLALVQKLKLQSQARRSILQNMQMDHGGFNTKEEFEASKPQLESDRVLHTTRAQEADFHIKETKHRLRSVRKEQVKHLKSVLSEGLDTRSEGLAWVVRELWRLGERVEVEDFPGFMDRQMVETVGRLAEKGEELGKLMGVGESQRRMSFQAHAHPDRWNNIKYRLSALSKHPLPDSESFTQSLPNLSTSEKLLHRVTQLKGEIGRIQEEEVRRIVQECTLNRMEEHLGASLMSLLSTILGADVLKSERRLITKLQQQLLATRNSTQTFSFTHKSKHPFH